MLRRPNLMPVLNAVHHSKMHSGVLCAIPGPFVSCASNALSKGIVTQASSKRCNHALRQGQHCLCREMGHLSSLPGLLRTQANIQKPLARQKVANLLAALDSVYLLLAPITTPAGHQVCLHLHHLGCGKTELHDLLCFSAQLC